MQITDEMAKAFYVAIGEGPIPLDLIKIGLEAALVARSNSAIPTLRCIVTGHIVGTDTRMIGKPCECPTCIAAACIEAQSAEIARLREALEPFGIVCGDEPWDDSEVVSASFPVIAFRRARAALETKG